MTFSPNKLLIEQCRLYDQPEQASYYDILIEGESIRLIDKKIDPPAGISKINAEGKIAFPGFIDVHIHGAGGADVLDGTDESLETICRTLAATGTTSFLGTTFVSPDSDNDHLIRAGEFSKQNHEGAELLGLHLEGPFINKKQKGGIQEKFIWPYTPEKLDKIFEWTRNALKMMTIAPELPGSHEAIQELKHRGVIAAFAHSDADYQETLSGIQAGINHVTHLFNAMRPIHHREPGPLPALFEHPEITAQIIGDGVHVHPKMVKFARDILGSDRCIGVTDGIKALGLPDGQYMLDNREFVSKDGTARLLDGSLIGSTMELRRIALNFMRYTGCSLKSAIDTVAINPARLLGLEDRKGSLEPGKDADIILLNPDDYSVHTTLVRGRQVYP